MAVSSDRRINIMWSDEEKKRVLDRAFEIDPAGTLYSNRRLIARAQLVLPEDRCRSLSSSVETPAFDWFRQGLAARRAAREPVTASTPESETPVITEESVAVPREQVLDSGTPVITEEPVAVSREQASVSVGQGSGTGDAVTLTVAGPLGVGLLVDWMQRFREVTLPSVSVSSGAGVTSRTEPGSEALASVVTALGLVTDRLEGVFQHLAELTTAVKTMHTVSDARLRDLETLFQQSSATDRNQSPDMKLAPSVEVSPSPSNGHSGAAVAEKTRPLPRVVVLGTESGHVENHIYNRLNKRCQRLDFLRKRYPTSKSLANDYDMVVLTKWLDLAEVTRIKEELPQGKYLSASGGAEQIVHQIETIFNQIEG